MGAEDLCVGYHHLSGSEQVSEDLAEGRLGQHLERSSLDEGHEEVNLGESFQERAHIYCLGTFRIQVLAHLRKRPALGVLVVLA